jgi:tRNA (guanine-N7-)-methyltransferase
MTEQTPEPSPLLHYHATSFSAGRMDFAWEELSEEERRQAYADWEAGKGLIGGDPRRRPDSDKLPTWGLNRPFFRALALSDPRGDNGPRFRKLLASDCPLEIEIGFGRGDFLLDRARRHPQVSFLGYETKNKATRLLLQRIERFDIANLWVSDDDCRFNLPRLLPDGRASLIHVLFPDPWWKPQHQVKRLFSPPFVDLLAQKLAPGGLLHFKSDVQDYGEWVRYLVEQNGAFSALDADLSARIGPSLPTHREHWCRRHQYPVYTYYFARK